MSCTLASSKEKWITIVWFLAPLFFLFSLWAVSGCARSNLVVTLGSLHLNFRPPFPIVPLSPLPSCLMLIVWFFSLRFISLLLLLRPPLGLKPVQPSPLGLGCRRPAHIPRGRFVNRGVQKPAGVPNVIVVIVGFPTFLTHLQSNVIVSVVQVGMARQAGME